MKLEGKICLITGGTRGIGAATAVEFARRGADLALNGRYLDAEAEAVVKEVEALGRRCVFIQGDMGKPEDARRCVEETVKAFGALDVLVHSAGGAVSGSFTGVSEEAWYDAFEVHVHAVFHLGRAAIPHIKARGEGAIILISSAAGILGVLGATAYATVKGALIHLTRVMARELAPDNIRVNCVAPGVIRTRFQDYLTPEQVKNNLENRIPLKREGTSEDVADVIVLLTENDFMTGETVVIDGGITSRIA
ncbi:MAG: SDR family NAD(P)-dependent oxidoreductase [Armatimonadetes bacterium]|nr:SDR family NAD(P)-dependent oxidoreductase [Armatimonadota bacterium]